MKILVCELRPIGEGRFVVGFECRAGRGEGVWAKWARPPVVGREYDVEIDVHEELLLDRNAVIVNDVVESHVRVLGSLVELQIFIEAEDDDGILYGRLSQDCLIMFESEDACIRPGGYIRIRVGSDVLELSPQGG